jgi:acyl carrier protein
VSRLTLNDALALLDRIRGEGAPTDPDTNLDVLGVDSLAAIEWVYELSAAAGSTADEAEIAAGSWNLTPRQLYARFLDAGTGL